MLQPSQRGSHLLFPSWVTQKRFSDAEFDKMHGRYSVGTLVKSPPCAMKPGMILWKMEFLNVNLAPENLPVPWGCDVSVHQHQYMPGERLDRVEFLMRETIIAQSITLPCRCQPMWLCGYVAICALGVYMGLGDT